MGLARRRISLIKKYKMTRIKRLNEDFGIGMDMDPEEIGEPTANYRKEIKFSPDSRKSMINAIIGELNKASDAVINEVSILLSIQKAENDNDDPINILANKLKEIGPDTWNSWTDPSRFHFLIFNGGNLTKLKDAKMFLRSLSKADFDDVLSNIHTLTKLPKTLN